MEWGSVGAWAGALATLTVALIALLASFNVFDRLRVPHLRITFEHQEPWCRGGSLREGQSVVWVRIGVENSGVQPARGCVGRLTALRSDGMPRLDVDPVQLRWAGMPRSRAFEAIDLRHGQREFLNVLLLQEPDRWRLVTFDDLDFDPGFPIDVSSTQQHVIDIAVFADNTDASVELLVGGASPNAITMVEGASNT